ncbi:choline dehydrogenase 7 [Rhizophlyctis rosea]|nr:choline dehydrogenase 7 [Rhizophlyctis rosea]
MSDVEADESAQVSRAASHDPNDESGSDPFASDTDSSLSQDGAGSPVSSDEQDKTPVKGNGKSGEGGESEGEGEEDEEEEEEGVANGDDESEDEYEEVKPKKKQAKKQKGKKEASNGDSKASGIPYDPVLVGLGDRTQIEKLISWRMNPDNGKEELLVKYKNMSYYHAEWLSRAEVEEGKTGKTRVKRFLEKPIWETQWSDDEPFNPNYTKIDRLLDEGDLEDAVHYLVKWCSQTYDMSTWEPQSIVEELDASKIEEFNARRILSPEKQVSYRASNKRPAPKSWKKIDESPLYKNDNQLRAYQLEGLNWLMFCWYHRQNSILADEMGLGKTVQSTIFLHHLYVDENVRGPFLIVTPLSTIGNWEREIKTWTDMNVVVYHGRDVARNLIIDTEFFYRDQKGNIKPGIYKFDIVLTTYEMAMAGAAQLRPIKWKCVVLDEAHRLKNKSSKVSEILKTYKMDHRVLLTGTPLQNSLDELWSLLNFLEPEKFSSEKEFQENYGSLSSAGDVEKLQALLKPLMLRRLKEDVEKSIPVKEETIVEVELTTVQKKWYRSILEKNFSWLKQGPKKNNVPNLINTMIELRKCCIHPFLLKGAEEQIIKETGSDTHEKQFDLLVQASGKMVLIDKLLKKLKAGGHKVLIFSQMTRCLDIIQDYLRGCKWGFERIDGGVRGDLRQAAIDRFSKPDSDTFVFLLCTRAGGVGINLTAADTCIIFDSDWNPQNDLQAQSRCHRIGQKKPVQIYRNTYEREMFDRASMKLGLDKAILQRMDAQNLGSGVSLDTTDPSKPPSSLSKAEIEELLKKGAYGAFMDDDASKEFCEEDIDRILERRTQVIRHDSTEEKSSIFSKASFTTSGGDNLDLDDPDFWDKVAQKANLEVVDAMQEENLIIDLPRQRRPDLEARDAATFRARSGQKTKNTTLQEFEPVLLPKEPKRGPQLKGLGWNACALAMVAFCLRHHHGDTHDIMKESRKALFLEGDFTEEDLDPANPPRTIPYENATTRQMYEYNSLLRDAPPEYLDHLKKKARNLISRISMMYLIRFKIAPTKQLPIPRVAGRPPVSWWGEEADRDLLLGICRHGYQRYDQIRMDPDLCFFNQTFQDVESLGESNEWKDDGDDDEQANDDQATPGDIDDDDEEEGVNDDTTMDDAAMADASNVASGTATPTGEHENGQAGDNRFPTASEIGGRLRRLLAAFTRQLNNQAREEAKRAQALERDARQKMKEEEKERKAKSTSKQDKELSKKEKGEFHKTLMSFGVEPLHGGERDWGRFQYLANLEHKSPQALETYYQKLVSMCDEVVDKAEAAAFGVNEAVKAEEPAEADGNEDGAVARDERLSSAKVLERDGDQITYDKAKKIQKRLEQMRTLREVVLPHPELNARISVLKRHGRSGLPRWWTTEHDLGFLEGISKWGLARPEFMIEDRESVFFLAHQEWIKSMDIRKAQNIPQDELVGGKWGNVFWMREGVSLRRFEALCDAVVNPQIATRAPPPPILPIPTPTFGKGFPPLLPKGPILQPLDTDPPRYTFQSDNDFSFRNFKPASTPSQFKVKIKSYGTSPMDIDSHTPDSSHKRASKKKKAKRSAHYSGGSSGEDTDAMLQMAQKRATKIKKKRRKEEHLPSDYDSELERFRDSIGGPSRISIPMPSVEFEGYEERDVDYRAGPGHSTSAAPPKAKKQKKKHKRDKHEHDGSEKRHREVFGGDEELEPPRKKHKKKHGKHKHSSKRESDLGSVPPSPSEGIYDWGGRRGNGMDSE